MSERNGTPKGNSTGQPEQPKLRKQDHGGALLRGGQVGNKGGTGRPPSELKRVAYQGLAIGIEEAVKRLQAGGGTTGDLVRLIEVVGKYASTISDERLPEAVSAFEEALMAHMGMTLDRDLYHKIMNRFELEFEQCGVDIEELRNATYRVNRRQSADEALNEALDSLCELHRE